MSKTLLIVDDDHTFVALLTKGMSRLGFMVDSAGSVEDATRLEAQYDFATIDLNMPQQTGMALIPHLLEKIQDARLLS